MGGSPYGCSHPTSWDGVTWTCPGMGDTHTVPTLLRVSASTPRERGLGGSPGVRAGPVAVFNPSKCLREAANGISWIMLAGAEGGCGTDGADDNGGARTGHPTPLLPEGGVPAPDWDTAIPCQLSPLSLLTHLSGCRDTIQGLALSWDSRD